MHCLSFDFFTWKAPVYLMSIMCRSCYRKTSVSCDEGYLFANMKVDMLWTCMSQWKSKYKILSQFWLTLKRTGTILSEGSNIYLSGLHPFTLEVVSSSGNVNSLFVAFMDISVLCGLKIVIIPLLIVLYSNRTLLTIQRVKCVSCTVEICSWCL